MDDPDWDDQASEVSDGIGSLDDPIEEKHEVPSQPNDDNVAENEDDEQREFKELTMAKKWETVMQLLITKNQAWVKESQEFGDSEDAIPLKPYLKSGLLGKDTRESSERTMLHLLAKDFTSGGFTSLDNSTQLDIITYLMDNLVPEAAQAAGESPGEPVLKLAMVWKNKDFLLYITKNFKEKLAPLINTKDPNGMNCLHYAFQTLLVELVSADRKSNNSQVPTTKTPTSVKIEDTLLILESLIQASMPESIAAKDNRGNTPIHHAVHYYLCRYLPSKHTEYFRIVKSLVEKGDFLLNTTLKENQFNDDDMSPYRYHSKTRRILLNRTKQRDPAASTAAQTGIKSQVPDAQEAKTHKAEKVGERGKVDKLASGHDSKGLVGKSHLDNTSGRTYIDNDKKEKDGKPTTTEAMLSHAANGHRATRGLTIRRDDALVVHAVNLRADDKPSAPISGENASNAPSDSRFRAQPIKPPSNTQPKAPQARPEGGKKETSGTNVSESTIVGWLKLHYIRTRPDTEAKELLYGKIASGRCFYSHKHPGIFYQHRYG